MSSVVNKGAYLIIFKWPAGLGEKGHISYRLEIGWQIVVQLRRDYETRFDKGLNRTCVVSRGKNGLATPECDRKRPNAEYVFSGEASKLMVWLVLSLSSANL